MKFSMLVEVSIQRSPRQRCQVYLSHPPIAAPRSMTGAPVLSTTCVSLTFKIPVAICASLGRKQGSSVLSDNVSVCRLAFVNGEDFTSTYCDRFTFDEEHHESIDVPIRIPST